jgi:hypothetical protein
MSKPTLGSDHLLAHQLAHVMLNIFPGATLGDVAGFFRARHPRLAAQLPGFGPELVRELQARHAFMPQWERKPAADPVDPALAARLSRFARIPARFPLVDRVVARHQARQPLADVNVLFVQHILGQAVPQVAGYVALGMRPADALFIAVPYHPNPEVVAALSGTFGLEVRTPPTIAALHQVTERAVDEWVDRSRRNGQRCLLVGYGPHGREYFAQRHPGLASRFAFTEQTAFGDRPEHRDRATLRVVSYARSDLKGREADFIGTSNTRAMDRVLGELGTGYEEKPVLILGYGSVGRATAAAFAAHRAHVYVYDPHLTPRLRAHATSRGYRVVRDPSAAVRGKLIIAGCSGYRSIDAPQIDQSDDGAIFLSASCELLEINMEHLRARATDATGRLRRVLAAQVNNQQTWHYWLDDGSVRTVVADGLPANFNDVNVVPPEFIDLTMALSLAAAVQAVASDELGYFDLAATDHAMLEEAFAEHLRQLDPEWHRPTARRHPPRPRPARRPGPAPRRRSR